MTDSKFPLSHVAWLLIRNSLERDKYRVKGTAATPEQTAAFDTAATLAQAMDMNGPAYEATSKQAAEAIRRAARSSRRDNGIG